MNAGVTTLSRDQEAAEVVARARAAKGTGVYKLGGIQLPVFDAEHCTTAPGWATDCSGFVCWAWGIKRDRPGFNRGPWSTVSDDVNTDSIVQDATHKQELFTPVVLPAPGDLLVYPGAWQGGYRVLIGHVGLISSVPAGYTPGDYSRLQVVQCHGPNGANMVVETDGSIWAHHDANWPKYKSMIVRVK